MVKILCSTILITTYVEYTANLTKNSWEVWSFHLAGRAASLLKTSSFTQTNPKVQYYIAPQTPDVYIPVCFIDTYN